MAITRARKALLLGTTTAVAAACLGFTAFTGAHAAPRGLEAAPRAAGEMPAMVENFNYPGAERVLEERKIRLKRGDGRITLVNCDEAWNIKVESRLDNAGYCFQATAKTGFLTLELPDAYGIWTENHPVKATLSAEGKETVVNVPKDEYKPVGESGGSGLRSVLVELRVTG